LAFDNFDGFVAADDSATKDVMVKAISKAVESASDTDAIVFYFSGHGTVPSGQSIFYFAPYDFNGNNEHSEIVSGLSTAGLIEILRRAKARRIIIIIDSCQSAAPLDSLQAAATWQHSSDSRNRSIFLLATATPTQVSAQVLGKNFTPLASALLSQLDATSLTANLLVDHVKKEFSAFNPAGGITTTPVIIDTGSDFHIVKGQP
jgi:hypothetical protein